MATSGKSVARIAETLREEKVLIPAAYQDQKDNQVSRMHDYFDPYLWDKATIVAILTRQEYLGHTVLGKTVTENFKTKKRRKAKPEELLFFPNTHEAIIDQETWDLANKMRKRCPKKTAPGTYSHRLSGFCYCADCGARMGYSAPSSQKIKAGTATNSDSTYNCGNFRNIRQKCTNHYVKATDLETAILEATKLVASHILQDEDAFVSELMEQWESKQQMLSSDDKKELAKAKNRLTELDSLIQGLYENQIKGIMPERQIQRLMTQYDDEQLSLEKRISELEDAINNSAPQKPNPNRFIALIKKYKNFDEISDAMLYELIDRIEVHAPVGGRGKYRYQQIDVCFNFIGSYLPPMPVITEEERRAAIDKRMAERKRITQKKCCARKKMWLEELKERAKTDPEAAAELEAHYEKQRANGRKVRARNKAKREADPEYQAMMEARRIEKERIHLHSNSISVAELKERAKDHHYLALGGVSDRALKWYLAEHPNINHVFLALDMDEPGEEACVKMNAIIPEGFKVYRLKAPVKDWNELLLHKGEYPTLRDKLSYVDLRLEEKTEHKTEAKAADLVPMIRMSDIETKEVGFLWNPYIPFGKLTILQGDSGNGKTYLAMYLCAACTNGKPLPHMEMIEPCNVIYQTAEDGLDDTIKPRLEEAGADLSRVLTINDYDTDPLTLADERIEKAIRQTNAKLVIIDPIQAFLGANVDMNRANEVRPLLRKIADVAQRTGCAIVLIGHLNKASGQQSGYRNLGSIDFRAASRSVLVVGKSKDDPNIRVMAHDKSSLAPAGTSLAFVLGDEDGFRWIGDYDVTADELLSGIEKKAPSKIHEAKDLILNMLSNGKEVLSEDIDRVAIKRGISSRTVRDAKKELGIVLKCRCIEGHKKVYWLDQPAAEPAENFEMAEIL